MRRQRKNRVLEFRPPLQSRRPGAVRDVASRGCLDKTESVNRPNFFVIGAAKCGTTSMCTLLGQHPDVFMSDPMEIHYFGREDPEKTRSWYMSHFQDVEDESAVGEGSTSYTHPHIIEACASEIATAVPDARLIYMVRHPIRRLESDWKMRKHEGWAPEGSINEAVRDRDTTLITHGLYWKNLEVYRRYFSDDQILVVFLGDFSGSPQDELERCFSHIGVDEDVMVEGAHEPRNQSSDFRRDRWLGHLLRRGGVVSLARLYLPEQVFEAGKRILTDPDRYSVDWRPSVKRQVARELAQDSRRFLEHCGKPPDYWTLT